MTSDSLSSDYLLKLCKICLTNPPEILPCNIFYSKTYLPENSSYILNLQKSDLPGSHWISVLVTEKFILYFDSLGLPVMNEYILRRLKICKLPIYHSVLSIQGIFSKFCGFYSLAFLIKCHEEQKSFQDFLSIFKEGESVLNDHMCLDVIIKKIEQVNRTLY